MIELNSGKYSLKLTRIWYTIHCTLPLLWPEQVYNDNTLHCQYPHLCAEYTNSQYIRNNNHSNKPS